MVQKPDYKPVIANLVGFLILFVISMFIPVNFLAIVISIFAGILLHNAYLFWISPKNIVSGDEWQITDVSDGDNETK